MTLYYIGFVLCILCSAFFSASEMAVSSANRLRLEGMRDDGSRKAARALRLIENYDTALSTILIGNNLVNIAASSISSVIAILISVRLAAPEGACATAATVVTTLLIIIFGETMPKIVAKKNPNRVALAFAGILRVLNVVLCPAVWCVVRLVRLITGRMSGESGGDSQEAAVEELQSIIETAEDEAVLDEDRSELLLSALDFSDISASEVMTARVDMLAVDIEDSFDEIMAQLSDAPYSRIPVYEGDTDNIIGVLHLNALYRAMLDGDGKPDIRPLLSPPCFVYKTVKLPKLLEQLRRLKTHLAIVTDEYGGTAGVVSMEDILETIVGDIWDETDEVEPEVTEQDDGTLCLDGDMSVGDFVELLGLDEDRFDFESETVGGWCMEMLDGFARAGDSFRYDDCVVTVLEADDKRVEKLSVVRVPSGEEEEKS